MARIIIQVQDRLSDGTINHVYITKLGQDIEGNVWFEVGSREDARILDQASHLETIKKIADAVFDFMLLPNEQTFVGMQLVIV